MHKQNTTHLETTCLWSKKTVGSYLDIRQCARVVCEPDPEVVSERLRTLRGYRWSSYRGYAGYCSPLEWVCAEPLSRLC